MRGAAYGIGDAEAQPGDVPAHAQEGRGILHCHDRDAPVVLVHAHRQNAVDPECAHARQHADGSDIALRHHEDDAISDPRAERLRQRLAQDHPVATRNEIGEPARLQMVIQIRDAPLLVGHHPAHHHAGRFALVDHQGLFLDVG